MNNITFYTHLKAQFHKKYHITSDTEQIYFKNKTVIGPLGKAKDIEFIVSLPLNGNIVLFDCSYPNEPMKNGVFDLKIIGPSSLPDWAVLIDNPFVLSMTTSLNNLNIETLVEGFKLAESYYKSVYAATEQFIKTVKRDEEGYQTFKNEHIVNESDKNHLNKIQLYDLKIMFESLGHYHQHNNEEHIPVYIDDYGKMILNGIRAKACFNHNKV